MTSRAKRRKLPEEVAFPVTPFLDMAFQLLAFFILTFRAPSRETRLDLYLPATPAALPMTPQGKLRPNAEPEDLADLETDLLVRAEGDERGGLISLRLGDSPLVGADDLGERLRRYAAVLKGKPFRVRLIADDRLRYEEAAKLIGACEGAGASAIRLVEPPRPRP